MTRLDESDEIMGTRTSGSIFTRSEGNWIANELAGKFAFSCAAGQYYVGTWLPILSNTTTALEVDGTLDATGTAVRTCEWNPIQGLYEIDVSTWGARPGNGWFWGGAVDNNHHFCMAPTGAPVYAIFNTQTKQLTTKPHGYPASATLFMGVKFYAGYFWVLPACSPDFVRIDPELFPADESITKFPHGQVDLNPGNPNPNGLFNGGEIDQKGIIWMAAYHCENVIAFDTSSGDITPFSILDIQAGGLMFPLFDRQSGMWIPANDCFIRFDTVTNIRTTHSNLFWAMPKWNPALSGTQPALYQGGCIDSDEMAFFSSYYGPIIKLDPTVIEFIPYYPDGDALNNWPIVGQWSGAFFDGLGSINHFPGNNPLFTRMNRFTGKQYNYTTGLGAGGTMGGDWDGLDAWLPACINDYIAQIRPPVGMTACM
jgi:hypothetical protein